MTHRNLHLLSLLLLIVLAGCSETGPTDSGTAPSGTHADENRPNIIVIYVDDLGFGDLSSYGAELLDTPSIDRLAEEGVRFTDGHAVSAICTPSRYALLTGQYPWREDVWLPVFYDGALTIDPERLTVADLLGRQGYKTAVIGKWHLGFGDDKPDWNGELKPGPLELGFDYYYGVPVVNSSPPFVYVENHRVVGLDPDDPFVLGEVANTKPYPEKYSLDVIGGAEAAHALYVDEEVATELANKAVDWIEDNQDSPFFLYFSTTNVHHPFTPHPRFQGTTDCGVYCDFIKELDWQVGEILDTLDENGLAENTLVVFLSDNGGMLNNAGKAAWDAGHKINGDFLGFKFDVWEGGHRVPFIARWPARIPANSVSPQLVSTMDLMATFASITGQTLGDDEAPDSVDLMPALTQTGNAAVREHLLIAPRTPEMLSVRKGKWMYIPGQGPGGFRASDTGGLYDAYEWFAYAEQVNSELNPDGSFREDAAPAQLYDLEQDPGQRENVYQDFPDVVAEMQALLEAEQNE